jgi:phosphohistidine phosphatase
MKLYLVQHANAATKEQDPERSLTEEGRKDLQKISSFIEPMNLSVGLLWHSGKRRAEQTAKILAEAVKVTKNHTEREGLAPNDDVNLINNELAHIRQDVMIVGHMPFLSKLASLLLTGSESANTVAFKQGGIVCLNRTEDNNWQIEWMVTPENLP